MFLNNLYQIYYPIIKNKTNLYVEKIKDWSRNLKRFAYKKYNYFKNDNYKN